MQTISILVPYYPILMWKLIWFSIKIDQIQGFDIIMQFFLFSLIMYLMTFNPNLS